jgi:hypothetical protein
MAADESIWTYNPSFALAIVVTIIYAIPTAILAWQTLIKYHSWFFLCVLIGSALEVGGYSVRAVSTKKLSDIVSTNRPSQYPFPPQAVLSTHTRTVLDQGLHADTNAYNHSLPTPPQAP